MAMTGPPAAMDLIPVRIQTWLTCIREAWRDLVPKAVEYWPKRAPSTFPSSLRPKPAGTRDGDGAIFSTNCSKCCIAMNFTQFST